jgi:tetratricopeptide (TPR) repeat protein
VFYFRTTASCAGLWRFRLRLCLVSSPDPIGPFHSRPAIARVFVGEHRCYIDLGRAVFDFSPRVAPYRVRAKAKVCLGRLEEAQQDIEEAVGVSDAYGELEPLSWALAASLFVPYAAGDPPPGLASAQRSLELAERTDNESSRVFAYQALAMAYMLEGLFTAARDACRLGASIIRDRRTMSVCLPWGLVLLAEAHLALGELAEALTAAQEGIDRGAPAAVSITKRTPRSLWRRFCWRLAAPRRAWRSRPRSVVPRNLLPSSKAARCRHESWNTAATLAAALGDTAASEQALREALDLNREIGATGHAERRRARSRRDELIKITRPNDRS